jgi:hypothetical protein
MAIKDRQYNGHEKREKRTDNTMVMRKETKGQTMLFVLLYLFS